MIHLNPERQTIETLSNSESTFTDKLRDLLPGVLFEETKDIHDARRAVSEALTQDNPALHTEVWTQYAFVCEAFVTHAIESGRDSRSACDLLRTSMIVHKAIIFEAAGNTERYVEELRDAETLSRHSHFHTIARGIQAEIDKLSS